MDINKMSTRDENFGMNIEGWITLTPLEELDKPAVYGIFEDKQSAEDWAKNCLEGTLVRPIWTPQFNRG